MGVDGGTGPGDTARHHRGLRSLSAFELLLWAFIVVGAVYRLWGLHLMEFKGDELKHLINAYAAAQAPWSPPLLRSEGTSASSGIFFYQFLALPAATLRDPVAVARFIALLNVASIPALFLLLRRLFAHRVALWTTALLATSPWMIVFSRKIWNPDLLVPFLVITLICLFSAMRRYAPWKGYAFAVLLALLSQLHMSVWLAVFPLLPLGLLLRPWRRPVHLAGGVATFVGVYLLTLGPRVGEFVTAIAGTSAVVPEARLLRLGSHNPLWSVRISTGIGFEYLLGPGGYPAFTEQAVVAWAQVVFLLYAVVGGAAVLFVIHRVTQAGRSSLRAAPDRLLLVLLLMAISLHLSYLVLRVVSFPHYHVILALVAPLSVALLLLWVEGRLGVTGSVAAHAFIVVVLVANVAFMSAFFGFVSTEPEAIDGDYRQPYFVEQERWENDFEEALRNLDGR